MSAAERPAVLVTEPIHQDGIVALEEFASVIRPERPDETSILAAVPPASAIVVRVAPITAAVIDAAPNLRHIQKHGVGVDSIDVDHATRRGIPVSITPEANAASVAEFAVASALALCKRLPDRDRLVRAGGWRNSGEEPAREIAGRTVGVIGGGRIGLRVLRAFTLGLDMQGLVFDPFVPAAVVREHGGEPSESLDDLLERSDIVTLHTPLTPETRHLINAERLDQMQPNAILVNTCRGPVVDEHALAEALAHGAIAGAAIDVFEDEPPVGSPLLRAPNLILSPHVAGITSESNVRTATHCAAEIRRVLSDQAPTWRFN
jgi:D-3-phosphoglycerate dehydrogenase